MSPVPVLPTVCVCCCWLVRVIIVDNIVRVRVCVCVCVCVLFRALQQLRRDSAGRKHLVGGSRNNRTMSLGDLD